MRAERVRLAAIPGNDGRRVAAAEPAMPPLLLQAEQNRRPAPEPRADLPAGDGELRPPAAVVVAPPPPPPAAVVAPPPPPPAAVVAPPPPPPAAVVAPTASASCSNSRPTTSASCSTRSTGKGFTNHTLKLEQHYWEQDGLMEDAIDKFVIELGGMDSSDSEVSDDSEEDISDSELAQPLPRSHRRDLSRLRVHRTWRFQQSPPLPPFARLPAAVNPQHQHSGRLQHISYAEALRKYPVLDSGDKSGSAAAVPRGVNGAQAASMSPGGGVLAGATEASDYMENFWMRMVGANRFSVFGDRTGPTMLWSVFHNRPIGQWGPHPGSSGSSTPRADLHAGDGELRPPAGVVVAPPSSSLLQQVVAPPPPPPAPIVAPPPPPPHCSSSGPTASASCSNSRASASCSSKWAPPPPPLQQ
ncbi:formin-like protein 5 [Homalodisca vitripennis]|uniref:formin-like protein 5 n=1 Tax=Homalodisca vitripennis TaxID=197043 RepID=UPI001EECA7FC|nr:formin-like protein 5 [Homalodisca vitripennis]